MSSRWLLASSAPTAREIGFHAKHAGPHRLISAAPEAQGADYGSSPSVPFSMEHEPRATLATGRRQSTLFRHLIRPVRGEQLSRPPPSRTSYSLLVPGSLPTRNAVGEERGMGRAVCSINSPLEGAA